ncbi:MAG TPA: PAS domain S-box protein [Gaiellaceae bacterium]
MRDGASGAVVGATDLAALLEAMLASSLDAVITIDRDGRVITFNAAAERTFGYTSEEAIGRDVAELIIPPALRERHYSAIARHLATGETTILGRRVELTGMRADRSVFPVELTVTAVPMDGPPLFTAYLRDVTERKQAAEEVLASRARIVEAGDRERQRIERNLHDGAQQRLVAISVLLRQFERTDLPDGLRDLVDTIQNEATAAISELRELARGIHPAALTEHGLAAAVRGLAGRMPFAVTTVIPEERLPPAIETAFYYSAAEGLTNAAKYAQAANVSVTVALDASTATLTVTDDGVGADDTGSGTGLQGLRDRIAAIGGTLRIESRPAAGTSLIASAPLSFEPASDVDAG